MTTDQTNGKTIEGRAARRHNPLVVSLTQYAAAMVPIGCTDACAICGSVVEDEDIRLEPTWNCWVQVLCVPCYELLMETREQLRHQRFLKATGGVE